MVDLRVSLLPWQLLCALFAILAIANADFLPTDDAPNASYAGQMFLKNSTGQNVTGLLPLSNQAVQASTLDGHLSLVTDSNFSNISSGAIALISCDRYSGNLQAQDIFDSVGKNSNTSAVVFYSTASNYCNASTNQAYQVAMYTTTSVSGSKLLVETSRNNDNAPAVQIISSADSDMGGGNNQSSSQNNPLGPSPSTAVAMIILYSITGVITALFLVIIITGAVRAHRHPDRYGPRDVLGRPRQSRARGLGRAILDTLPIVKFGEKEQPKPTDVELGSTSEARAVTSDGNVAPTSTMEHDASQTDGNMPDTARNVATTNYGTSVHEHHGMEEGIAPAVAGAASAAPSATDSETAPEEALGCSICTDDFEKGQDIRVLPCDHKFHPECVDPWLLNVSGTCPLCRVDLRPVLTNTSADSATDPDDPNHLAAPLGSAENDPAYRRRSNLRDILSFRTRPNASPAERIYALRRLREQQRRNGGGSSEDVGASSTEDVTNRRRSNTVRMSSRLSGMFGRARREESPQPSSADGNGSSAEVHRQEQR